MTEEEKGRVGIPVDNKILTKVEPEEVELLVSLPIQALSIKTLEKKIQLTQLCEKSFFPHFVITGIHDKMRPNADDGWRAITPLCVRKYSISRSYPKTEALAAIPEGTTIEPVLEVLVAKIFLTDME